MSARLRVERPSGEVVLELGRQVVLGRAGTCDVVVDWDPRVSRQHAMVREVGSGVYQIVDLGSRNGTFVGEEQVVLPRVLREGDWIRIGETRVRFELAEEGGGGDGQQLAMTMVQQYERRMEVALLVCDVRNFSMRAEALGETVIARFVGTWFRAAGEVVLRSGGVIDKFLGDAFLAYWVGDARSACRAALECAGGLGELAAGMRWPEVGDPLELAIAMHYGSVSCGNVGLVAQRDATILGDSVNTVFRMEQVCKQMGARMVMSENFRRNLSMELRLRDYGKVSVKGKTHEVHIWGVE